jgi:hypothetical protein
MTHAAGCKSDKHYDPLWNISPQAPLVQRIGAGILGMFFLFVGCSLFYLWIEEDHSWIVLAVSLFSALVSVRPIWNAFKGRRAEPAPPRDSTRE